MKFLFHSLSYYLKERPLLTNMVLSTTVGFCGDIVCQTVYEPATMARPPLTRDLLPDESVNSPFLIEVQSPYIVAKSKWQAYKDGRHKNTTAGTSQGSSAPAQSSPSADAEPTSAATVLLDLRRSMIFCSFTFLFGVPFFLQVYKRLDKLIPPTTITKRQAIFKGFLSWIAAQVTNPLYLTYVTAMDHFFIYRDGRDGRRRVMEVSAAPHMPQFAPGLRFSGHDDVNHSPQGGASWLWKRGSTAFANTAAALKQQTVSKMGHHYRFVDNPEFNYSEYAHCVYVDSMRKMTHDFPDIVRYGLVFWGMNWLPMFYYIPGHFRLAYSSLVQVVWSGIMSHLMHRGGAQKKVAAQA